jgi:putative restriction endonuclease
MSTLDYYVDSFKYIKPHISDGQAKPHKICMLLATLDLAYAGGLQKNEIKYAPPLLERYLSYFKSTKSKNDVSNPQYPFCYLSGKLANGENSFWHLETIKNESIKNGYEKKYIDENVKYAYLDLPLFELLKYPKNIKVLESTLAEFWFDRTKEDLDSILIKNNRISEYERRIRVGLNRQKKNNLPKSIRDPAFRKVVTEIYDFRCAATGSRIILPSGEALVEAAHIFPFSEGNDDDPRNGLALTPNMHWAMDKNIIAPGPDKKWHVSKLLDRRIPDLQIFINLDGCPIILPKEAKYEPKIESLEWRLSKLKIY